MDKFFQAMDKFFRADITQACEILHQGGIILYPSDTLWAIGCDATNETAVQKIRALKNAPPKPMLVLLHHEEMLNQYVSEVPDEAYELLAKVHRPLTLIYPGGKNVAPSLKAPDGSLGIRIPYDPYPRFLCKRFGKPVVATSANLSGEPPARRYNDIAEPLKNGVDYIAQKHRNSPLLGWPSTIFKLETSGDFTLIRQP